MNAPSPASPTLQAGTLLAVAVLLGTLAIGGAWYSEVMLGYNPCKLCLWQRWPYYLGLPFGMAALVLHRENPGIARVMALCLAVVFVASIGLGIYHAGVEWKWWLGPAECGGKLLSGPASVEDFRKSLSTAKVIRCDDAAVRVLGLSFAGWNVLVSAAIAGLAVLSARKRHGSSSVSQYR